MEPCVLQECPGSFRDPSGTVFSDGEHVYRAIHACHAGQWEIAEQSGFLGEAVDRGLLIAHEEGPTLSGTWKTLKSPLLPFVSYPYEWCFGQLKAAALHTLDILDLALERGLILRDATAYNVQFVGAQPVFIDLLSFESWAKDRPWQAYLQFCRHFLAPLALMARRSVLCGRMLSNWIEGLPLDLTSTLLPWRTWLSPSLAMHIHLHARMQAKYADARKAAAKLKNLKLSENTVPRLSESLRLAVENVRLPRSLSTEWGGYYNDTNYSQKAATDKKDYLLNVVAGIHADFCGLAVDLGANTAEYSEFLAERFMQVVAADVDYLAVEKLYQRLRPKKTGKILPLVMDLCNPPPGIGWGNAERVSFLSRCRADYLSALAIIHHLAFTGGIPLAKIAEVFATLVTPGGLHVLEFVPLEDSQVQRLLAARSDSFPDYTLDACLDAFAPYFELLDQHPIAESCRILLLMKRKEGRG